jgi:membrane protein implicated in regulation of membrane protease activity
VLFGFDLQGWIAVIGGILLALITLFTGYDHVDLFGRATIWINQQIGVSVLLASLATLVVEAQLASRRRNRERYFADRERNLAARRAQRQNRCTLAQLEFQFSPNGITRRRLSDLIALLREYGELA